MPPTGNSSVAGGSTARQALSTGGGSCSAGKSFNPSAPASSAANASVGVATPSRQVAARLGRTDDARVAMRHHHEAPAGIGDAGDVVDGEHAGADQAAVAEAIGEHAHRGERLRRVERHLGDGEAGVDQRRADGADLGRLHAAQHRDQRHPADARAEERSGVVAHRHHPAMQAIRNSPSAAASSGPATAGIAPSVSATR